MPYKDPAKANQRRRERYYANLDHEHERSRVRYREHRDEKLAYARDWQAAHPDKVRQYARDQHERRKRTPGQERARYMKRHGGIDEWARMFDAQNGLCYLCQRPMSPDGTHVDHDHSCDCGPSTKSGTRSCTACRRGLAHPACNQIIGLAGEDMELLRTIIDTFEPAKTAALIRIDAKAKQESLI